MFRRVLIGNHRPPSSYSTVTHHQHHHHRPHLSLLADKCTSIRQLQQIHAQMLISATIHDNFAASRLLSYAALSHDADLTYASKLFHSFQLPNMFMWNTLIRGLSISPNPHESFLLYIKMLRIGVAPGKHTFSFLLKACCNLQSVESCKQVHSQVVKYGFDLDFHVVNNLIRGYSVSYSVLYSGSSGLVYALQVFDEMSERNVNVGLVYARQVFDENEMSERNVNVGLVYARRVFDEMTERNVNVWTTMVCGYAQNGRAREAIALFNEMVGEGFEPNGPSFSSVLSACAQSGCLEMGEKVHRYIMEKGFEIGVILGTALVNMYAKNGAILMARSCFDGMRRKNIVTWNAMISGLAVHGHAKEAVKFFRELEQHDVKPNDSTLVGVLSACCHAGMLDYGRKIFNSMSDIYGIDPKIQHYGCMVDLLGRGGMVLEAEELINKMLWKADLKILGALLSACGNHGNFEVAERVVKKMLVLEPDNHGVYVVLSNMYADAGRWDDVSRLREIMKEGSLKKTPGWSLVGDKDKMIN